MFRATKRVREARLDLLKGLGDKQVKALYSVSAIKKLRQNEVLFKEGDIDQSFYVVLVGKIDIIKTDPQHQHVIDTLSEGDFLGDADYLGKSPRTVTAMAQLPSSVMVISAETFDALELKTQIFFQKLLYDSAVSRLKTIEQKESALTSKNTQLMEDLFYERTRARGDFADSEIIHGILKKIPRLPAFASSLVSMLLDEKTSADDLTEQVRNDPSLVGTVMKAINSPYYGFKQKITDIHRAIVMLGFNEMYQLIVSEGMRQVMPNTPEFREVHSHCVGISRIATILSQETHIGKSAEMATLGLLHDLGNVVKQLLAKQNPKLSVFIDNLDTSKLGALLLKSWGLPDIIWKSVEFQYYPEFTPPEKIDPEIRENVTLLYFAHLCYEFFMKDLPHRTSPAFLAEYEQVIRLDDFTISDIARVWILPGLKKNLESLPVSIKQLISEK